MFLQYLTPIKKVIFLKITLTKGGVVNVKRRINLFTSTEMYETCLQLNKYWLYINKLVLNTRFVVITRNNLFNFAYYKYLKLKRKYNTCVKGYVRWITKYDILQHELTTAMQYQLINFRQKLSNLTINIIQYVGKISRGLSN